MKPKHQHIILELHNLSIGYASKGNQSPIYSDINIKLEKGTFVSMLGENGIGKSTLLRTISKIQAPLSGEIHLDHKPLASLNSNELAKKIALVLTEKLPESNLTVFELVALGRQPYTNWIGSLSPKDIEIVNKSLKLTSTEHLAQRKFYQLSDGQLQRVLIARALAQETEIIILDEPTAHLDIRHKLETFELLKYLALQLNKTVIISTHEIHTAIQHADELWLMTNDGCITGKTQQLVESKTIEKLFSHEGITFDQNSLQFSLKRN